jgi:hypothetical protein
MVEPLFAGASSASIIPGDMRAGNGFRSQCALLAEEAIHPVSEPPGNAPAFQASAESPFQGAESFEGDVSAIK